MRIRKLATVVEEILEDGGKAVARPVRKVAAVAVIENPFAERFVEDVPVLVTAGTNLPCERTAGPLNRKSAGGGHVTTRLPFGHRSHRVDAPAL